jgi:hypothetical protein
VYPRIVIAGFVALNSLCASAGVSAPAAVTVYDSTQVALGSYVVVERVGLRGWHSAFSVPGYATEEEARGAVLASAARAGADAVTNLVCMSQTDSLFKSAGYYCYANAIKLKQR